MGLPSFAPLFLSTQYSRENTIHSENKTIIINKNPILKYLSLSWKTLCSTVQCIKLTADFSTCLFGSFPTVKNYYSLFNIHIVLTGNYKIVSWKSQTVMAINSKREVMYVPEWRGCSGPGCHVLVSAAGRETIHGSPRSSLSSYHGIWPGSVVALYFVPLSPAI